MNLSNTYCGITQVTIGDGSTVLFWKDLWLEQPLEISHPRALLFVKEEDSSVADFLAMTNLQDEFFLPLSLKARDELRELQEQNCSTYDDFHIRPVRPESNASLTTMAHKLNYV